MKTFVLRLKPEQDLRQALETFTQEKDIKAGFILTAIGSLKQANIRFANQNIATVLDDKFEIVALNSTLATTGVHIHIAIVFILDLANSPLLHLQLEANRNH